jgi:hypothetical protein
VAKPYSKRTKNIIKYAKEQTEQARNLDRYANNAKGRKKTLHKSMVKKGPDGQDIILPGYHKNADEWNEEYDTQMEMRDAQESDTPFPMKALLEAAVREHGMPKRRKKQAQLRKKAAKARVGQGK